MSNCQTYLRVGVVCEYVQDEAQFQMRYHLHVHGYSKNKVLLEWDTLKQLEEHFSALKSSAFPWPILTVLGMLTPECRHINLCTWLKIISLSIACIMYDLIFISVQQIIILEQTKGDCQKRLPLEGRESVSRDFRFH